MLHVVLTTLAVLCVSFSVWAGQYDNIPLEKVIPPAEQSAMGLQKLTPTEREKLRIFIIDKSLELTANSVRSRVAPASSSS